MEKGSHAGPVNRSERSTGRMTGVRRAGCAGGNAMRSTRHELDGGTGPEVGKSSIGRVAECEHDGVVLHRCSPADAAGGLGGDGGIRAPAGSGSTTSAVAPISQGDRLTMSAALDTSRPSTAALQSASPSAAIPTAPIVVPEPAYWGGSKALSRRGYVTGHRLARRGRGLPVPQAPILQSADLEPEVEARPADQDDEQHDRHDENTDAHDGPDGLATRRDDRIGLGGSGLRQEHRPTLVSACDGGAWPARGAVAARQAALSGLVARPGSGPWTWPAR